MLSTQTFPCNYLWVVLISILCTACGGQYSQPNNESNNSISPNPGSDTVLDSDPDPAPGSDTPDSNQGVSAVNPYIGQSDPVFLDSANWLCHPELNAPMDVCDQQVDSTSVSADGSATVSEHPLLSDSGVDCFYVYPTVSDDPTPNSDRQASFQERETTRAQFSRYRSVCQPFAPIYRQVTLPFLQASFVIGQVNGDIAQQAGVIAYEDVLAAFKTYINELNNGRPFILVGHSQGTIHLKRLIAEQVEQFPYLQERMVAAHLIGFSVEVPKGTDIGGTFNKTPACRSADQSGCVVAFSAYRQGDPEIPNALFGRASSPDREALCVNPAELLNAAGLEDDDHFLAPQIPRILPPLFQAVVKPRGSAGPYANPLMNISFDTYFYAVPEQIIARCADFNDEVDYLEVRVIADPTDPRADDYAAEFNGGETWGLHLADMNLVMDDLLALAQRQIDVYKSSLTQDL